MCDGDDIKIICVLYMWLFIIFIFAINMYQKEITIDGGIYVIRVSNKPNKKYVVWRVSEHYNHPENPGKYIRMLSNPIHFGDSRYEHYKDLIGYYKELDHLDEKRRANYRSRHRKTDINNPNSAAFWSWNYLW